ncbi:MAG TPA: AAA family ATPase [Candidatus Saccharimonadales bacterium]|nr:AAA family ATPase [Candidatus Saccharimonadales bacterium]
MQPTIIGITGQPGAGKDTLAQLLSKYLTAKGLKCAIVPPGDLVRAYVEEHHLGNPGDRSVDKHAAEAVRQEKGSNYWIEAAIAKAGEGVDLLLYPGMRHATEVGVVRIHNGVVITVDAPQKVRFERVLARKRAGDATDFETFAAQEQAERNSPSHQVDKVIEMSDTVIENAGTLHQFEECAKALATDYPENLRRFYTGE